MLGLGSALAPPMVVTKLPKAMRYGYGTEVYHPDVEYFEAVDQGVRQALHDHVRQAGGTDDDIAYISVQQCSGEQQ